jgi:hypothetical protein
MEGNDVAQQGGARETRSGDTQDEVVDSQIVTAGGGLNAMSDRPVQLETTERHQRDRYAQKVEA